MAHCRTGRAALALILSLALLLTMPVSVLAAEEDDLDFTGLLADDEEQDQEVEEEEESTSSQVAVRAVSQQSGDPLVQLLNSADLSPRSPSSEALDQLLDEILYEILDDGMDTYEQVSACYDYLVQNVRYGSHMSKLGTEVRNGVTCRSIYSSYGEVEGFGAVALTANQGLCNAYASAFILMTRKIGLDSYLVRGSTRRAGGGYTYHEWAEININGSVYLFDPQLEQDLVKAGLPRYSVFCKTYAQVNGRYSK